MIPRRSTRPLACRDPASRARRTLATAITAVVLALTAFAGWPALAAADDQVILRIDPPAQDVVAGQEFVVNVIQRASVATTGVQANVTYHKDLLKLKDFELGPAYTDASAVLAFGNADAGTSGNKDAALARANTTGVLENVAAFLLPGSGTIAAGDNVFLRLTFVAQPGKGGRVSLGLGWDGTWLDEIGQAFPAALVKGTVTVIPGDASGSAPPGSSAVPSPGASAETLPVPSEVIPAPSSPVTPVSISVAPTTLTLNSGDQARIFLIAKSAGDISSVAADLTFDPGKLQLLSLEPGPAWGAATRIAVASGSKRGVDAAIAEANSTGVLQQAGAFFAPGRQELPFGDGVFVSVLVKAKADATTGISLGNASVLGVEGEAIAVTVDPSSLTPPHAKGIEFDPVLVGLVVFILAIVIGATLIARFGLIPVRVRRRWPFYLTLLLGLIPVVLFLSLVLMLVVNSAPVVNDPGIAALFGTEYSSKFSGQNLHQFGLLPALTGSVLITLVATAVALPISLALAVVAVDFPLGPVTRLVRPLVSILSGIPPIVYAVSVPAFITLFMIPKFAANTTFSSFSAAAIGADSSTWPPPDVPFNAGSLPWDLTGVANSTVLGGFLIALFLIPFVTPLLVDALRDVPRSAREASLALGANRTYTIRRVVLPRALPAIAGAAMLAVLKALGDTLIVAFAVGWSADRIPSPLFDILERTPSLAAQGAGLIGSFETLDAQCLPAECAVGYSGALMLLLFAAVVVLVITYLQARGRRRVAT